MSYYRLFLSSLVLISVIFTIVLFSMGSSFSRDSNILIYMNVDKQYYVAGQFIQGQIYLDVKTDRPYSNLCLRIEGDESVTWTEQHGKTTVVYTNSYDNYRGHSLVVDFHGTIKKGQYMFPFRLQIPAMMTGSFYISRFCHIRYLLKAVLVHQTSEKDNQIYEMFLNMLQPPRMPLGQVQLSNTVQSKCCSCCCSYGTMTASLCCDKNFVRNGDTIYVKGLIDNTRGKKQVQSASVVLQQILFQIASNESNTNYHVEKSFTLHRVTTSTPQGQQQQFSFNATIPAEIIDCTAIGRIVARYFILYLDTEYGCCSNTVDSALHIVVHSKTPVVVEKKTINSPAGWNPQVYPRVECQNMIPYLYKPLPLIPFLNLPGQNDVKINLNMESEMNLMQNKIGYEIGKQIVFENKQKYDYQPQYYDQGMFSDNQRIQQGYQPYFVSEPDSQQILRNK